MKVTVKKPVELDIRFVHIVVPNDHDDIPAGTPGLSGRMWSVMVDIETGQIQDWPNDAKPVDFYVKVTDRGSYSFLDENHKLLMDLIQYYAPNEIVPGEYGDYIDIEINEKGVITNWSPNVSEFQERIDEYDTLNIS